MCSVSDFDEKFNIELRSIPRPLSTEELHRRFEFLHEELTEYCNDIHYSDFVGQADALVDMVYVIKGIALAMGLGPVWHHLWDEVHRTNMAKIPGNPDSGKYAIKPKNWRAPDIERILKEFGYVPKGENDDSNSTT
jgi:predicted HAD superfamily Cof-like phosphohydrolase